MRHVLVVAAGLLVACGSSDTESPPEPVADPVPVEEPEPELEVEPARGAHAPPTPEERATLRRRRAEARQLVHAEQYEAALSIFVELVEDHPNEPRLLCEAGDAAERAGDAETAARYLETGLRMHRAGGPTPDAMRVPLAMCLYNRGRLYERQARPEAARRAYEESLALRPNATVRARLLGIGVREVDRALWPRVFGDVVTLLESVEGEGAENTRSGCAASIEDTIVARSDESERPALAVLESSEMDGCPTSFHSIDLAVRETDGYRLYSIASLAEPTGDSPNEEQDYVSGITFTPLRGVPGLRWRVDFHIATEASSMSEYELELEDEDEDPIYCGTYDTSSGDRHEVVLCADENGRCYQLSLSATSEYTHRDDCEDESGDSPDDESEGSSNHVRELVIEGDSATLRTTSGSEPDRGIPDGTRTVAELLALMRRQDATARPEPSDEEEDDGEDEQD